MADEVILCNGDRVSGELKGVRKGRLTLDTSYAGTLSVEWKAVCGLDATRPMVVITASGQECHLDSLKGKEAVLEGACPAKNQGGVPFKDVTVIREPGPSKKTNGRINLGLSRQEGNSDSTTLNLDAFLEIDRRPGRYSLGAELDQTRTEGSYSVNRASFSAQYDRFLTDGIFGYVNTGFKKDELADLGLRSSLGAGGGWQAMDEEWASLSLEAGVAYVVEDYTKGPDAYYTALRWAIGWRMRTWADLELFHNQSGLLGLGGGSGTVIKARTGLRIPMRPGLSATIQNNLDWNSKPATGSEELDLGWLFMLGYLF